MNINEKILLEKDSLELSLYTIQKDFLEEQNKIDKQWFDLLNETKDYNGKKYTLKKAIEIAKQEKLEILKKLENCNLETQNKLMEKLIKINENLTYYNNLYEEKEKRKNDILYDDIKKQKGLLIKESIEKITKLINERLEELGKKLHELIDDYVNGKYDSDKYNSNRLSYESEMISLKELYKSMSKLLSYNGCVDNEIFKDELLKKQTFFGEKMINYYYDLINKDSINMKKLKKDIEPKEPVVEPENDIKMLIEDATYLVEEAEKSEKFKDYKIALDKLNALPECEERKKLISRLKELAIKNKEKYSELYEILKEKVSKNEIIESEKIEELDDRFKYLPGDDKNARENHKIIIDYYNNFVQEKYQMSLKEEDLKKHSLLDKTREFMGSIVNFVSGTKVANKFLKNKLSKLKEKLDNEENDKKKNHIENKIEKLNNNILDNDIVTGVRLFKARNKLSNQKLKLYHEDAPEDFVTLETGNKLYKTKATDLIGKKLSKGLSKIIKNEELKNDKKRAVNVLDQYLELIASGTYEEEYINQAFEYLNNVKDVLSENEYNGYLKELEMICNYRCNNFGIPYHIDNNTEHEVNDIIKFYDSDDYEESLRKPEYIKRK